MLQFFFKLLLSDFSDCRKKSFLMLVLSKLWLIWEYGSFLKKQGKFCYYFFIVQGHAKILWKKSIVGTCCLQYEHQSRIFITFFPEHSKCCHETFSQPSSKSLFIGWYVCGYCNCRLALLKSLKSIYILPIAIHWNFNRNGLLAQWRD